jgi:two-component system, sensor histidine kinase SagS
MLNRTYSFTLSSVIRQVASGIRQSGGGTGLGLFISSKLASQQGGNISVDSTVDVGSTFTLTVPLRVMRSADCGNVPVTNCPQQQSDAEVASAASLLSSRTRPPFAPLATSISSDRLHRSPFVFDEFSGTAAVTIGKAVSVNSTHTPPGFAQRSLPPRGAVDSATPLDATDVSITVQSELPVSNAARVQPTGAIDGDMLTTLRAHAVSRSQSSRKQQNRLPAMTAELHVLLTDDESSLRMFLRRSLKQSLPNAVFSEAANGNEACIAIEAAKDAGSPLFTSGIVCMDKEMPVCDGFEAAVRLRAMGFSGLILGVTGNAVAADTQAFVEKGVDAVIFKPVSMPVLVERIHQFALERGLFSCAESTVDHGP